MGSVIGVLQAVDNDYLIALYCLSVRPSSSLSAVTHQQSADSATASVETEGEREARIREEMQLIVSRFVCGEETIHHLSADLNSYQRMITHQVFFFISLNNIRSCLLPLIWYCSVTSGGGATLMQVIWLKLYPNREFKLCSLTFL